MIEHIMQALDDVACLRFGELRMDRNRERFRGRALAVRKRAGAEAEICETFLKVHRLRVIDLCSDAALLQFRLDPIAIGDAKLTCCQPEAVSPVNVAVPRSAPVPVQRCPTCVPVLPEPL